MDTEIPVVILCGGLGTRIREETDIRPKPMVYIGSRPILWHIMKLYANQNFKRFVLALGFKGDVIKNYIFNMELYNNDFTITTGQRDRFEIHYSQEEIGWNITLAQTGETTLKGARIKKIEQYIDSEYFMVTYGDGLSDININELMSFHKQHGKIATVTGVMQPSSFGMLGIDGDQVRTFSEKPQLGNKYISGGFFVFHRKIFDYLNTNEDCDLEIGALETLAQEGELMVYKHHGFWSCMDTYRDVEHLNKLWNNQNAAWKTW